MATRIKIVFCVFAVIFFNFLSIKPIKAIPLIGNIYGSLGGTLNNNHTSGSVLSDIKSDFSSSIKDNKSLNLSLGVASDLPIPVIRNLRLELSYIKSLCSSSNNLLGLGAYYDIKVLPIIKPYLGISLFNYNSKIVMTNNLETIKHNIDQGLTSFNAGVSLGLPLVPLSFFAEYKYAIPGIFSTKFNFKEYNIKYNNKDFHLSMITVGFRFYFL